MKTQSIGWERTTPIPDHQRFTEYLSVENGRLYLDGFDLTSLVASGSANGLTTPLEIVYLPIIRDKIRSLREAFRTAIEETNYAGEFRYAYASKANAAEEVVRTVLATGVHYEISSWIDVEIVYRMKARGLLSNDRWVICNGFKPTGSQYAQKIIQLQKDRGNVLPVVEDLSELPGLAESGVPFDVGLRLKSYGNHGSLPTQDKANSRFGLDSDQFLQAAKQVSEAPNLNLKLFHAMVGSQITGEAEFVSRLTPSIELFARMKQVYPSLEVFDFGGGMPVRMTLDFQFDYEKFAVLLPTKIQEVCRQSGVDVPHVMGEFGRYTVAEHGAHIFKIVMQKENRSALPWYILDGSLMSSFPDIWALGEHFIVLPINHLDQPFRQVQLGGITCDSDDVYPPKASRSVLYLPRTTEDLYIGFFSIGAYQEMLGGVGGSKHCVIPEALELVIDRNEQGDYLQERIPGQSAQAVLDNLGYR
jgi:arginine decarboxylase